MLNATVFLGHDEDSDIDVLLSPFMIPNDIKKEV